VLVILFRSRLTAQAGQDYADAAAELLALAQSAPGFIDIKSFTAEDGERLTVVRWRDAESLRAWREHPRHIEIQTIGREKWYEYYRMEVAEVSRTSSFDRSLATLA
jgi:heme-degrading monooxygenase HmoA